MSFPVETTHEAAVAEGCDTVQFKYDGLPAQYVIANGLVETLDMTKGVLGAVLAVQSDVRCTLIGTYVPSVDKRYVYDCWAVERDGVITDLRHESYRTRYSTLRVQLRELPSNLLTPVVCYPIVQAKALWNMLPTMSGVKGLVYRNSRDTTEKTIRVIRWYPEVPKEFC